MKKNITPKNTKFQRHGLWTFYNYNNDLLYKGQYINGVEHGYWIHDWILRKQNITFYLK